MSVVCVVAAHPDDETLGCAGTLLKHGSLNDTVHWLIATDVPPDYGWSEERLFRREEEIKKIETSLGFQSVTRLRFSASGLEAVASRELIQEVSKTILTLKADIIYFPWPGDIHSDHRVLGEAVISATKKFRCPRVRKVLSYETLSETNFSDASVWSQFTPNWYVDVSAYLEGKLDAVGIYDSEIGGHPFPRSKEAVEALALLRGSEMGVRAAEAFHLHRNFVS